MNDSQLLGYPLAKLDFYNPSQIVNFSFCISDKSAEIMNLIDYIIQGNS